MDQQAALRWVQRYIGGFGGDPRNVTLFGESAGGLSVLAQLVSPGARGLFQRAIVESGTYNLAQASLASAESSGAAFTAKVGCASNTAANTAACLRRLPVSTILDTEDAGGYYPNIDSAVLPRSIGTALATGQFSHVPVIIGTNHDEWRLFIGQDQLYGAPPVTAANYVADISSTLSLPASTASVVAKEYPLSSYSSPAVALGAVGTDAIFACPALVAERPVQVHAHLRLRVQRPERPRPLPAPRRVPVRGGAHLRASVPVRPGQHRLPGDLVGAAAAAGTGHEARLDELRQGRRPRLRLAKVHRQRPAGAVPCPAAPATGDGLRGRAPVLVLEQGLTRPPGHGVQGSVPGSGC